VSWLDVAALVLIALSALAGFRRGLVVGLLSLAGLAVGAVIGAKVVPQLLGQERSQYVPLIALAGALTCSFLAQAIFSFVGRRIRTLLFAVPPLRALDRVLGFVLGGLTGLALCWVVGAVMLYLPGQNDLKEAAQRSSVLRTLNDYVPPAKLMEALSRAHPFAIIAGPAAEVAAPDPSIVDADGVQAARQGVVRIQGHACGYAVEGTGWIAAPGLVVTAAHVVAGVREPVVDRRDGNRVTGVVVAFDADDDVALVRAPGLSGTPLRLAETKAGTSGAILGFPANGPYRAAPARVGREVTFLSRDAYGNFPVTRTVTLVRGEVQSGNSGGPVVSAAGRVLTTIFGARLAGGDSGYGVPNDRVERLLRDAGTTPVESACHTG
jgi:uncharacterized membrane protein required for colicin V production